MTDDIVVWLRDWLGGVHLLRSRLAARSRTEFFMRGSLVPELLRRSEEMCAESVEEVGKAADEIERLRAALLEIIDEDNGPFADIARAALAGTSK